jgi:Mrp family chromosome partitioning ATPase
MDRLERALQKAREQRETVAAKESADAVARVANAPQAPPNAPSFKTKKIVVPENELERHRIVARMTRNSNADVFRILRTKVLRHLQDAKLTTVAVTSPNYGDGKTTVAVNLALSLALDVKQTVLLVDLDLRDPTVNKCLGIEPDIGLSDYFVDDVPVAQCLVNPGIDRLVILPVRNRLEASSEALGTPKMAKLAHELKTRYPDRIVIYDMPPILAQDDVIAFLPLVDAVLLVVRDAVTPSEDIRQCMHALEGANLIGTVLNNSVEKGNAHE